MEESVRKMFSFTTTVQEHENHCLQFEYLTIETAKRDKEQERKHHQFLFTLGMNHQDLGFSKWHPTRTVTWMQISLPNMTFFFLPAVIRPDGKAITTQIVPEQNVIGLLNSVVATLPGRCKSGAKCFPMCYTLMASSVSCDTWASSNSNEMLKQFS